MRKTCSFNIVLVLLMHFFKAVMAVTDITTDQTALLALKDHISDDPYSSLVNWSTAISVCSWNGVTCDAGQQRVTALNISSLYLNGTIPSHIGNLSFLALLSLRDNRLHGSLPLELFYLHRLESMDFGSNFLTGSIPAEIGNLTMLNELYLHRNSFKGMIPSSIGNCTLLKEMNFSENNLIGPIPPEIGNLRKLETLEIHSNSLRGSIPSAIFNISTIITIAIHENHLSGTLPSSMGLFLPNLVELRLRGNKLWGRIPSSISNASKLIFLDLSNNSFTGSIPDTLGNLRHLQRLNLGDNHLTSRSSTPQLSFLSSLTNCKQLQRLELSGNPLDAMLPISIGNWSTSLQTFLAMDCNTKGSIPREIGNLSGLIDLRLGNNELSGTIPITIGRIKYLQGLYLQGNRLQGTIPHELCDLGSLVDLSLDDNELSGSIPECLGYLKTLRNLSLSSNNLTSAIPLTLWSLSDILVINMSSNSLNGSLPGDIENLKVVIEIDLSRNQLTGSIPNTMANLVSLAHFSIAKNRLQGPIPESLSHSLSLEFLDLSCNNLSGVIPMSLEGLSYLQYFNVSFNQLRGEIPGGGPFANFSAQSYMMNNALCGMPRLQVPPCKPGTPSIIGTPPRSRKSTVTLAKICLLTTMSTVILVVLPFIYVSIRCQKWKRKSSSTITEEEPTIQMTQFSKQDHLHEYNVTHPLNGPATIITRRITFQELQQATDRFSESNLLGIGTFGSVYKGTLRDGMKVAIKVFNAEVERGLKSFDVESKVILITRHRNLIRFLGSCCSIDFKALVLEYMPNGSLEKWLHTNNYHLDVLQRLDILIDVGSALEYLHYDYGGSIIHSDLNPSNVLLDENMVARVSDFSIAKLLREGDSMIRTMTPGTIGYMAPEYGFNGIVSTKTDVYSFGILLMETFTGKKPSDEMFIEELSLKHWVEMALPHAVDKIVDSSLMQTEEGHFAAKQNCIAFIMKVALNCSTESPMERIEIKHAVGLLKEIKIKFLEDIAGD